MSTTTITGITKSTPVQISQGEEVCSIRNTTPHVIKVWQSTASPDINTEPMIRLHRYEERIFFGLGVDTEYVFAVAEDEDVSVVYTPAIPG